jgi:hypothetical protein
MLASSKNGKIPTNPKLYGAVWTIMHLMAKHANTDEKKKEFMNFLYLLSVEFPCGNCRNHIQAYLHEHPFEPFMNMINEKGEDIGMFKWSWMFHNTVNARIHKPIMEWETAYHMYDTGHEICTNCSASTSRNNSLNNSLNNSAESPNLIRKDNTYQDSFEEDKKVTLLAPPHPNKNSIKPPKGSPRYVDKKTIVQGYFLKKHNP